MTTKLATEQTEAREELRKLVHPGDTVYTVLRHRAASGMYRALDLFVIRDNEPLRITGLACTVTGRRYDRKHEAMGLAGCGMDMGFDAVYSLSMALFCPDKYDHDAAYSLQHRWL